MNPSHTIELWPKDSANHAEHEHGVPRIEVYLPAKPRGERVAAVVICPGGGYQGNAEHEGTPVAQLVAEHGMVGVVCWYRVKPHGWPASYADAARAVRLTRAHAEAWGVDPGRVALMGFSAGGHNAATVATQPEAHFDPLDELVGRFSARPDRLALGYLVISFVNHGHIGSMQNLLGTEVTDARKRQFSGEMQVTGETPPTFLFHADRDPGVPSTHSLGFAAALERAGVPYELHIYPAAHHGQGLALHDASCAAWSDQLMGWLERWEG